MKRLIYSILYRLGFELHRRRGDGKERSFYLNLNMQEGLERFGKLNLQVNTIVDVGAAEGGWSLGAREIWPDAKFILFEPLAERKVQLENLVKQQVNFTFVPRAAGKAKDQIKFYVSDDLDGSGIASESTASNAVRSVDVSRIDAEVAQRNLKGPFIVKLDTHGFEVPILEGCSDILDATGLFIIECYGFQIADNSLLFWEMCQLMDKMGFRLFDIVDVMRRPDDNAFWQCDAFFIRKDNSVFSNPAYR